jgi:hypothetical protein
VGGLCSVRKPVPSFGVIAHDVGMTARTVTLALAATGRWLLAHLQHTPAGPSPTGTCRNTPPADPTLLPTLYIGQTLADRSLRTDAHP